MDYSASKNAIKNKATKICTLRNEYYSTVIYEYRGHEYEVEYSNSWLVFKKKPAYLQHKEAQARIDQLIEKPSEKENDAHYDFDKEFDEIWELLGW